MSAKFMDAQSILPRRIGVFISYIDSKSQKGDKEDKFLFNFLKAESIITNKKTTSHLSSISF